MRWRHWSEAAFAAGVLLAWLALLAAAPPIVDASRHWVP